MATDNTATILTLPQPTRPKTPAERAKAYRDRQRLKAAAPATTESVVPKPVAQKTGFSDLVAPAPEQPTTPVTSRVTPGDVTPVTPVTSRDTSLPAATIMLNVAAVGLAMVGVTMNGWFARSLGSSDIAGWLFLAVGVAADLVALAVPSCSARSWQAGRWGTALAGWAIWFATFGFALLAGLGFASVNITDVTTSRASRVTPAIVTAQNLLTDAMASRDRECSGGVGKNCRAREDAVAEQRRALEAAQKAVGQTADPQIEAASRTVAWLTAGALKPAADDFAMLRLILLALLPQAGGILLMVGRPPKT